MKQFVTFEEAGTLLFWLSVAIVGFLGYCLVLGDAFSASPFWWKS
jgi:hypothetical protein